MTVHVRVSADPIDASTVLDAVGTPEDGAVLLFLGTVRRTNEGRAVSGMRYEAYVEMAEQMLGTIASETLERTGASRIAAVHRIGELAIGEVSVAIALSTAHRAEAFDGGRYVIEEIKKRLPEWKHEHYVDRDARWLDGQRPKPIGAIQG
jgi:molybdopterin synthase catalytic subunit